MGTSSSFKGPSHSLTPNREDGSSSPQKPTPQNRLQEAKRNLTKGVRNGPGGGGFQNIKNALSRYITATGGPAKTVAKFQSAIKALKIYLRFIESLSSNGFDSTVNSPELRDFNLKGKNVKDALIALENLLCDNGGQLDEAEARNAWFEMISKNRLNDGRDFKKISPEEHLVFARDFLAQIVVEKICMEIGHGALHKAHDIQDLQDIEGQLYDFVRDKFRDHLEDISQIGDQALIDKALERAFSLIEAKGEQDD